MFPEARVLLVAVAHLCHRHLDPHSVDSGGLWFHDGRSHHPVRVQHNVHDHVWDQSVQLQDPDEQHVHPGFSAAWRCQPRRVAGGGLGQRSPLFFPLRLLLDLSVLPGEVFLDDSLLLLTDLALLL